MGSERNILRRVDDHFTAYEPRAVVAGGPDGQLCAAGRHLCVSAPHQKSQISKQTLHKNTGFVDGVDLVCQCTYLLCSLLARTRARMVFYQQVRCVLSRYVVPWGATYGSFDAAAVYKFLEKPESIVRNALIHRKMYDRARAAAQHVGQRRVGHSSRAQTRKEAPCAVLHSMITVPARFAL